MVKKLSKKAKKTKAPYIDIWLMAVRIAHYCPGFGNPFDLSWGQMKSIYDRLDDLVEELHPLSSEDHANIATRMMVSQERYERRRKANER